MYTYIHICIEIFVFTYLYIERALDVPILKNIYIYGCVYFVSVVENWYKPPSAITTVTFCKSRKYFASDFCTMFGSVPGQLSAWSGTVELINCCWTGYSLRGSEIFSTTYWNIGVIMIQLVASKQANKPATKASKRASEQASKRASEQATMPASKYPIEHARKRAST